jgi:chemotaxis protein MotB
MELRELEDKKPTNSPLELVSSQEEQDAESPLAGMLDYKKARDDFSGDIDTDGGNWIVSYADMMTLLLGFFIMLLAFAKIDPNAFDQIKIELAKAFGTQQTVSYSEFQAKLDNAVQQGVQQMGPAPTQGKMAGKLPDDQIEKDIKDVVGDNASLQKDDKEIVITFGSAYMFDPGSAVLTKEGKALVQALVPIIMKQANNFGLVVEGHTDSRPISSDAYPSNWELSSARAATVVRILEDAGFPHNRMKSIGWSDTRPIVPEKDEVGEYIMEHLDRNRRVVVRIVKEL